MFDPLRIFIICILAGAFSLAVIDAVFAGDPVGPTKYCSNDLTSPRVCVALTPNEDFLKWVNQ